MQGIHTLLEHFGLLGWRQSESTRHSTHIPPPPRLHFKRPVCESQSVSCVHGAHVFELHLASEGEVHSLFNTH